MGRRSRNRQQGLKPTVETTEYADAEGNVLTVRDSIPRGTLRQLHKLRVSPSATQDDQWQRRGELLFESSVVGWTISGLPLEGQRELLGRYRMADSDTRRWVRDTLEQHLAARHPDAAL
jgi:hypothetical protein